jgi:hypothetical protein
MGSTAISLRSIRWPALFRASGYREFETLDPKMLPPLLSDTRSAEILKFHAKILSRLATSGFSLHYAPTPCRQDPRNAEL